MGRVVASAIALCGHYLGFPARALDLRACAIFTQAAITLLGPVRRASRRGSLIEFGRGFPLGASARPGPPAIAGGRLPAARGLSYIK